MSEYIVREVDPSNPKVFMDIVKMHDECFPNDTMYVPVKGHWWIAYCGKKAVAFAGLTPTKAPGYHYMCRAGVTKKHRGQGLQKRLIQARLKKAKEIGAAMVVTSTYENPSSSNNLIDCGFRMYTPNNGWGATGTSYWQKAVL